VQNQGLLELFLSFQVFFFSFAVFDFIMRLELSFLLTGLVALKTLIYLVLDLVYLMFFH